MRVAKRLVAQQHPANVCNLDNTVRCIAGQMKLTKLFYVVKPVEDKVGHVILIQSFM